jgi:hypothetical protein
VKNSSYRDRSAAAVEEEEEEEDLVEFHLP